MSVAASDATAIGCIIFLSYPEHPIYPLADTEYKFPLLAPFSVYPLTSS